MQSNKAKETNEFNLDDIPAPELSGHSWIQRGTELVCLSCQFTHGQFIPPEYQLYGINEKGEPMLRKIKVQSDG